MVLKAIVAYNNQNYKNALGYSWILVLLEKNYSYAPYIIGNCYCNGLELPQNIEKSLMYYMLGSYTNMYECQQKVGLIYYSRAKLSKHIENKKLFYNTALAFFIIVYKNINISMLDKMHAYYKITLIRAFMIIHFIEINSVYVIKIPSICDIIKIIKEDSNELDIFREHIKKKY